MHCLNGALANIHDSQWPTNTHGCANNIDNDIKKYGRKSSKRKMRKRNFALWIYYTIFYSELRSGNKARYALFKINLGSLTLFLITHKQMLQQY